MEQLSLLRGLQADGVFLHARRSEIIVQAANRDHQRVIADMGFRCDFSPLLVTKWRDVDEPPRPIEPVHFARAISEPMPMGLRQEIDLMDVLIHAARCHLVQQWLPKMGSCAIHKSDLGAVLLSNPVAKLCRKLEPSGSTSDDDNSVQ